jgi:GDP-L-fucose synthase
MVHVFGSGNQRREFLYSADAARGAMEVLEHYPEADPVNIGTGEDISIRDLLFWIWYVMKADVGQEAVFDTGVPEGYPRRKNDISKMLEVTGGWRPQVSLREGLEQTVAWYKDNLATGSSTSI